ncbi:plant UBX domain-containing protein 2 [Diospyros lotus]|uniref:plant UBX domain-containing protein 2 n=1 Tax=Diospyros lotus TaxID=55363 RepID=UPI0022514133|nr:plant UBX domain-containing protein 2 [Diospyros lotus]
MDDVKDKVKGFMKKVNKPFSSSSSGKFKGQGRVLGSSSSSEPANPILARPYLTHPVSKPSQPAKPSPQEPLNLDHQAANRPPVVSDPHWNSETANAFDPYGSLITSGKRNKMGYSPQVFECPVCGRAFGSEEEVSDHVDSCLNTAQADNVDGDGELVEKDGAAESRSGLESCVGVYVSGKPSEGSVEIVIKLLRNVVKEPENAKFRRVRMGNPKIREAIGEVAGGVELLECVGFGLQEENGEMWAVMEAPSNEGILLIKKAISLLESQKVEKSVSAAPSKSDEPVELRRVEESVSAAPSNIDESVEPRKVDRQVRVFFSVPESIAAKIELPESFYNLSLQEVKREADTRRKKMEESQLLIPKSYKEKQAKAARKRYTKTVIRVQFPDGVVLQGVFSPGEPTTALYEFVSSALKEPSLEFELLHPVAIKRRAIPHFPAAGGRAVTLEEEDLVPAALVKFRPFETDSTVFTGLCNELLQISEPLVAGSAVASV